MPTFFARRYARRPDAIGRTEKVLSLVILVVVAGLVAAIVLHLTWTWGRAPIPCAEIYQQSMPQPFPASGLADWAAPERVESFAPDELYQKINGRADLYLQHGVKALWFGTYTCPVNGPRTVDVYWYEMDTPANAARIYEAERAPDAPTVGIGDAGYQVGGAVFFRQGANYVQVIPGSLDGADAQVALTIARQLAGVMSSTALPTTQPLQDRIP